MKFSKASAVASLALLASAVPTPSEIEARASVQGFDISNYQGTIDFAGAYNSGARFVIIKATEGTDYIDPGFSNHYVGATNAGFIRGGYHFAHPDTSSGATQATYFLAHGGGWSGDGITLPGMLDIEYNPSGATCYGLSQSAMVAWIQDFSNTYHAKTTRYPMIYSTADWWSQCTGNSATFSSTSPLVLARYASSPGTIPGGWPFQTIWQNSDSYAYGGDSDIFNGAFSQLQKIATG
ncbi:glycoside hydrolase family 25 protein [Oidiodendron maius Zn]|uniref:Lysozyme n=1 Tax=Oidiodendron maius (strain Zn) TaxID=913774 RepID=A0A0C3HDY9_OIDMZ|nr:glycoside hydrolase family 25 protein [Oidiodendron maius Zn]